jgi:hypothetical protein
MNMDRQRYVDGDGGDGGADARSTGIAREQMSESQTLTVGLPPDSSLIAPLSAPSPQDGSTSGVLRAELSNNDVESQTAPLSVSFMSTDLDSVISGIVVMESDRKPNSEALPLERLIYRVKSGIFTVL